MMKWLLYFVVIFWGDSTFAQTNVYHPFPDSNAVWNGFDNEVYDCHGGMFYSESYSNVLAGDTLLNNISYHKLFTPIAVSSDTTCPFNHPTGYTGCIRQDILNKKVFIVLPGDTVEQLLYDFDLQVGDTLNNYIVRNCLAFPAGFRITQEDSILIGNNYRKRWYASSISVGSTYIIEGIGSTQGLLDQICSHIESYYELTCFSQNGQTLFPDTITSCNIINATNNIPVEKFSVTLFPNPFHTSAKLEIRIRGMDPDILNCELKIYNINGTLVRDEEIIHITPDSHRDYILHRAGLSAGLYFYMLTTKENELVGNGRFLIE